MANLAAKVSCLEADVAKLREELHQEREARGLMREEVLELKLVVAELSHVVLAKAKRPSGKSIPAARAQSVEK